MRVHLYIIWLCVRIEAQDLASEMARIFFGIEGGLGSVDTVCADLSYSLL